MANPPRDTSRAVVFLALVASTLASSADPESWSDPSLPAKQALALWLDATRQPSAWQAHAKPSLASGSQVDVCYDASGHARHFTQTTRAAQPRFVTAATSAALRFDG